MRITFVLPDPNMGGGTRVIAIYARKLQERGHQVVVVGTPSDVPPLKSRVKSLLRGEGWPKANRIGPSHFDGIEPKIDVRRVETMRPITDKDVPDADVVIATWWETAEWVAAMSPSKGAKAYFIQGYEIWGGPPARVEATWRLPMHKIVISKWLMDLAVNRYGDPTASHVPNSVDTRQFHAPPRGRQKIPTVGMLYATGPFKGCDVALAAFEAAARQIPLLSLKAFGKEQISPALKLPPFAQYTRLPAQDKIRDIYARCDVWLCGSRSEGFHLPPLEAMACRCPVVSTAVGGPMDVIEEGRNGFLAPIDNVEVLTEKLVRAMRLSPAEWRAMSDAAYETATRYTWDNATDQFEQALLKLCRSDRSAAAAPAAAPPPIEPAQREMATSSPEAA